MASKTKKPIHGVGINDADYDIVLFESVSDARNSGRKSRKVLWKCPYYKVWYNMLSRVYGSSKYQAYSPWSDASVCEVWLVFSNFKSWMEAQDWKGKHLDKDIIADSKIYSPDTAVFVSRKINAFFADTRNTRASGNICSKQGNKYQTSVTIHKNGKWVGSSLWCDSYEEAIRLYCTHRDLYAKHLTSLTEDSRVKYALINWRSKISHDSIIHNT